jgi:ornithine cyclodeaminase/alanine dehydrogenase
MTRILTQADVASVLTLNDCILAVEQAFHDYAAGQLPKPESLGMHAEHGTFHVKVARARYFAAKVNANFPRNPTSHGLPTIQGVIVVMDLERGRPLGILDSALITTLRTAAATAVAAKYLSRTDAAIAAIIGCGALGRATVDAVRSIRPVSRIRLWDIDLAARDECASDLEKSGGIDIVRATSVDDAVEDADIIVTCTPSTHPFLEARHAHPGVFIAAVGADNPDKSEIAPELMARVSVVPDLLEQAATMGDLHHAIQSGVLTRDTVHGELGEVVIGRVPARRADDEMFLFDSTGTALQDVVVASLAVQRAAERAIGTLMALASDHSH